MAASDGLLLAYRETIRQIKEIENGLNDGEACWVVGDPYELIDELERTARKLERELDLLDPMLKWT